MFTFGVAPEGSAITPASDVRVVGRRYHSRDEKFVLSGRSTQWNARLRKFGELPEGIPSSLYGEQGPISRLKSTVKSPSARRR